MEAGQRVADVEVTDHEGRRHRLSELVADGPVVLFFYPKAFTGGCTAEACHFRDLSHEFAEVGARPIGISRDEPETQARFRDEHRLGFPLLSDPDGSVAKVFGAKRVGPLWSKRHTFVVDEDLTVLAAIRSESDMEKHADEALEVLRVHA